MLEWIFQHTLIHDWQTLTMALLGALCIGVAKAGLSGCGMLSVLIFADIFGAKSSTGVVLPMLIVADIMGVILLRKGGSWKAILPLAIPAMIGVLAGWILLDQINDQMARKLIGWLILSLLILKWLLDRKQNQLPNLHFHPLFRWTMGISAGVSTMLANAAGPVMSLYLLSYRHGKEDYLGIFVRFFLFINWFKVPFSAQIGLINPVTLITNLVMIPAILTGIYLGWRFIKAIPQKVFERLLIAFAILASLRLIFVS